MFDQMQRMAQKNANFSANPSVSVPRFAEGGAAYGPMLAVVDDNKNAHADSEIIAPLSMISDAIMSKITNFSLPGRYTAKLANRSTGIDLSDSAIGKIVNGLSENFALAATAAAGGGGGPMHVNLYLNGNEIAEANY